MKNILTISLLLSCGLCFGQKQGNIWMFGQGGALDFNSGIPIPFSGSQVFSNPTKQGDFYHSEGSTSISDSSGSLLFYSNGEKVWNKLNQIMPNGNDLKGFYSSTTAAFAIPVPQSDSLYYLFTTDGIERGLQNGLRYSIINMCLDNGKGDVINSQKNILLLDTVSEKLSAVAHPNGTDIWLIAHKFFSDAFYSFRITPTGISAPIISHTGSIHVGSLNFLNGVGGAIGQMKASSDGSKIGLVFANVTPSVAELFDFDTSTGVVSNAISLQPSFGEYGVEFSPDNSKLYITNIQGLFQFDISSGNQGLINTSKTQISSSGCIPRALQLGPDGKIYVAQCSNYLGVINNPNDTGISCNYVKNSFSILPAQSNASLPVFIAGYNYKNNKIPNCFLRDTSVDIYETTLDRMTIHPNPFSNQLTFSLAANEPTTVSLYDFLGQQILQQTFTNSTTINTAQMQAGIYFYELRNAKGVVKTGKVVKQ